MSLTTQLLPILKQHWSEISKHSVQPRYTVNNNDLALVFRAVIELFDTLGYKQSKIQSISADQINQIGFRLPGHLKMLYQEMVQRCLGNLNAAH
ncbi:MAG TPA: hypothetical protein V6C88_09360 [Chroococcidiopsis sp.]